MTNNAGNALTSSYVVADNEDAFHVYTIEWFPDRVDYYVDDVKYFTIYNSYSGWQSWPYDKPFYLILNIAVGGTWGGAGTPSIDESAFPMKMEIDYVRVYQANTDPRQCWMEPAPIPHTYTEL